MAGKYDGHGFLVGECCSAGGKISRECRWAGRRGSCKQAAVELREQNGRQG